MKYVITRNLFLILCVHGIVSGSALANTVDTFDAFDWGWYKQNGEHRRNLNTFTGQTVESNPESPTILNSYFAFDLKGRSGPVASAVLRIELEQYYGTDPFEMFTIYDVSTPISNLTADRSTVSNYDPDIFNDLQTGNIYGASSAAASDVGTIFEIPLSSQAVSDINNISNNLFAVGIHINDLTSGLGTFSAEGLRWTSGLPGEQMTHELILMPVPIPASLPLFISGIAGLFLIRKKTRY